MNRTHSTLLLSSLLCSVLPLHAQEATNLDTIIVKGKAEAQTTPASQINSFGGGSWKETPASINVLPRDLIETRQPRTLSELARSDASLGDNYAAVGYYQNVAIRGFPLDLATGLRFNDLTIAGEQRLALEHIEQVEILKGEAGLTAGIMAPGGIINYVAKRPAPVQNLTVGTDSNGSRYTALDWGHWLTPSFGLRFNAAWEDMHSYVKGLDNGRRNFYALAVDWLIGEKSKLELDANYQTSSQRSVAGYQLLGGNTLPSSASAEKLLGDQPWALPVTMQSANITARYHYQFNSDWQGNVSFGNSRSVIDDNVTFAYGCFYVTECVNGSAPGNYFSPNGDYDVYDYRSPNDTRHNQQVRAQLQGRFETAALSHELTIGVDGFRHTVDRHRDVYDYVGTANINQDTPVFAPSPNQPGPSARILEDTQYAAFALDRIRFGNNWQWLAGGRFVKLDEVANNSDGIRERHTQLSKFLPQTALLWQASDTLNVYASYSQGLSLGKSAPLWTSNAGSFLAPMLSRQTEVGAKFSATSSLDLGAAIFRISQPFQYAKPDASELSYTFVQQGEQAHTGLELTANGKLTEQLRIIASASILQAHAKHSGTPEVEGHQLINIPKTRASVYLDYQLSSTPAWGFSAGWRYASPNVATADGTLKTPAYHVFDAGARFRHLVAGRPVTWQLSIDNLFDTFYWRDTGSSSGDYYLLPGAPRQARLSVNIAL